jgi:hypothetical protein
MIDGWGLKNSSAGAPVRRKTMRHLPIDAPHASGNSCHPSGVFYKEENMRVMARVSIPVEAGNKGIRDGSLPKVMQQTAERWKPEAAYFTTFDGRRTAFFVFDMPDASGIPPFAEPFFMELDAEVQISPVMNTDDLQKGLSGMA